MKFSDLQDDIFVFIEESTGSILIEATAGSGKTTTIIEAASRLPPGKTVLFAAFNKFIAAELRKKLPDHVDSVTLNSLGHRTYARSYNGPKLKLVKNKVGNLLIEDDRIKRMANKYFLGKLRWNIRTLVGLAKSNGVGILVKNDYKTWSDLIYHNGMIIKAPEHLDMSYEETEALLIKIAKRALKISSEEPGTLDFDDQLYYPLLNNSSFKQYDVIFIDEAQDLSAIQRELIARSLSRKGRIIAVGDHNQSIYGFRAADTKSLEMIKQQFKCTSFPLSTSYRCPSEVVKLAREFALDMNHAPGARKGTILKHVLTYDMEGLQQFKPGDLVLCRNSGPLIKLAFYLLDNKVQVVIKGDEMKRSIATMIGKFDCESVDCLLSKILEWGDSEKARLRARDEFAPIQWIEDSIDLTYTFADLSGCNLVTELKRFATKFFGNGKDNESAVILSTVHKAKGLEAERVHILDYDLMPSKYASMPWMEEQERNLAFVALTRSKDFLAFIRSPKD